MEKTVSEAIKNRRSVRIFKENKIEFKNNQGLKCITNK